MQFIENVVRYGSIKPIEYVLEAASFPTAVYWSDNDLFATPQDVRNEVLARLPNVVDEAQVPAQDFNHVDFYYGRNLSHLLNHRVIEIMQKFNP